MVDCGEGLGEGDPKTIDEANGVARILIVCKEPPTNGTVEAMLISRPKSTGIGSEFTGIVKSGLGSLTSISSEIGKSSYISSSLYRV